MAAGGASQSEFRLFKDYKAQLFKKSKKINTDLLRSSVEAVIDERQQEILREERAKRDRGEKKQVEESLYTIETQGKKIKVNYKKYA